MKLETDGAASAEAFVDNILAQQVADERRARWSRRWRLFRRRFVILIVVLALAFFVWIFRQRMFITVHSGEVLLIYYRLWGGTAHNQVHFEGLHVIVPWDQGFLYKTRTQAITIPMTVLSKNGLEVHLDAQLRFHVVAETVPYLHRRYGPDYVNNLIVPQLAASVQKVIGQYTAEELYSSENGAFINHIFEAAKRLMGGLFVEIEDIALLNIKIPLKVQEAVQAKAEAEQKALAQVYVVQQEQLEAQRKLIEAKSLQQYNDVVKSIPRTVLIWKGIEATLELAKSPNSKIIVFGKGDNLPLLLGNVPETSPK